jgi:hypothetical protein
MRALSPLAAATEGFQVMRREPRVVLAWGLLWLAWFLVAAGAIASGGKVEISNTIAHRTLWEIFRHYGPFAAVVVALFFLVWGVTAIAAFRAVLQPLDRRFFYLRLGWDELRVAAISLSAFTLVAIFGGAPGFLLIAMASPIMAAVPTLARDIGELGAWVTVGLEVWLCVRLSLIAVETFAEHRFHLSAYWPLTRGRFWYLLGCYFIMFLIFFAITILFLLLTGMFSSVAFVNFTNVDIVRRTSLLALAGLLAVVAAAYWVSTLVLFCACQAHAYRAISSTDPAAAPPRDRDPGQPRPAAEPTPQRSAERPPTPAND